MFAWLIRRKQFSLRTLFLLTTVVALAMSYLAVVWRSHQTTEQIAQRVEEAGGSITFDTDIIDRAVAAGEVPDFRPPFERYIFGRDLAKRIVRVEIRPSVRPGEETTAVSGDDMRLIGKAVTLRSLQLQGPTIDDDLFLALPPLADLAALILSDTRVSDRGVAHLKCFPALASLTIHSFDDLNDPTQQITDAGLDVLGNLDCLERLELHGVPVTGAGLPVAPRLPRLRRIDVSHTAWTDDGVERLATLQSLEEVCLLGTSVTDEGLKHLATLPNLKSLDLTQIDIAGPGFAHIGTMAKLECLRFGGTHLQVTEADAAQLANARALRELHVKAVLPDAAMKQLASLGNLEELDLSRSVVSDRGAGHLAAMRTLARLDLSGTGISDAGLQELAKIKNLRDLDLSETKITGAGLRAALPKMKSLKRIMLMHISTISAKEAKELQLLVPSCRIDGAHTLAGGENR